MQALCTLQGLKSLPLGSVRAALTDPHPGVRRQAVRLAEAWLNDEPSVGPALRDLANDNNINVRFQLALSLGEWDDPRAGQTLGRLAVADANDVWMRAAVLSSATKRPVEILAAVLASDLDPSARRALVGPLVATAAATGHRDEALAALVPDGASVFASWRIDALADLLDASKGQGDTDRLAPALDAARRVVNDTQAPPAERASAVRLLGFGGEVEPLAAWLDPRHPAEVQTAAIRALSRQNNDTVPALLLRHWKGLGPARRSEVLDALLARPSWASRLLDALDDQTVLTTEIDAAHRQRLRDLGDAALQKRAAHVLEEARPDRREIVTRYRKALDGVTGDPRRGHAVFVRACAGCHRLGDVGHEVGPDLAALTDRTPEALAIAILDPNREVDARYASYAAALADGRVLTGLIASETGNAITLKRQDGQTDVILRDDLDDLRGTGQSLMPEGLERDIPPTDLADLLAFLDQPQGAPKSFAGNHPETVEPDADGVVRLTASTAAIYGASLIFEPQFGNLGYWHNLNDRAIWTFRTEHPGRYTVTIEWACDDASAGNHFQINVDNRTLRGTVAGTGAWANYRSIFVGEAVLNPGTHRLEFQASEIIQGALLDLRAVVLTPRTEGLPEAESR